MKSFEELLIKVNEEIDGNPFTGDPAELYEPLNYILSLGGKRIRPVLALMGAEMFGGSLDKAMNPALGIEVFHNFTLMHDDIMDAAPLRRNQPTVHHKWNSSTAILSGDIMLVKAYELFFDVDKDKLKPVLQLFSKTAAEVCEGQQLDMLFETRNDVSLEEYIRMIELKTAVLLGASLKMGALIAEASEENAAKIYSYGKNIGIGFQLMDDILDVYADPENFGKQVGGDILSNKKTWLLIKALQTAEGAELAELNEWIAAADFDPSEKVKSVTAIYNDLGIKEMAIREMDRFFTRAEEYLAKIDLGEENKSELKRLSEKLKVRIS